LKNPVNMAIELPSSESLGPETLTLKTPDLSVAFETERRFLVKNDDWKRRASVGTAYRQGYIFTGENRTLRVRVAGNRGFLTLKGLHEGITRHEYDYEIPLAEAEEIMSVFCERTPVEKVRYTVEEAGTRWEVDVFSGANHGLVIAEVEISEEGESIELPGWAGEEVTGVARYLNVNLYLLPVGEWPAGDRPLPPERR